MRYRARDSEIVWEAVEGEVLLIDLNRGIYFSLLQGTAQLASDLFLGCEVAESAARWRDRFPDTPPGAVEQALQNLTEQMLAQGLLVARETPPEPPQQLTLGGTAFPPMERYEDMQEIFEMDPIHDGDLERGWPVPN